MVDRTWKYWIDNAACAHRFQCHACRGDEGFRKRVAERFTMPPGWPACPFGVTLDDLSESKRSQPEWFYARKKICEACDNEDCLLKHMKGCARNNRLKRLDMICPNGKWPSGV